MTQTENMDYSVLMLNSEIYKTADECPNPTDTVTHGCIPNWIEGKFIRSGPGKFEWGDSKYNHWFDGDAILQCYAIRQGKVKFSSQFIRSASYIASEKRGKIAVEQFATHPAPADPCENVLGRFSSHFTTDLESDNCNDSIIQIKGQTYAGGDILKLWKIDKDTVESLEVIDVAEKLSGLYLSFMFMRHWAALSKPTISLACCRYIYIYIYIHIGIYNYKVFSIIL